MKTTLTLEEFSGKMQSSGFRAMTFYSDEQPSSSYADYVVSTAIYTSIIVDEFLCSIWLTNDNGAAARFDEVRGVEELLFFDGKCTKVCIYCGLFCPESQIKKYYVNFSY